MAGLAVVRLLRSNLGRWRSTKLLVLLCLLGSAAAVFAADPPMKEIQAAAQAGDFARLESWVTQSGVASTAAANILCVAALSGDRAIVDRLLDMGISANSTNESGVAPLLTVARNGQTEMVRHLLQRGAKANTIVFCGQAGCKGHTPLMGAVCKQDLQTTKLLLEAGADARAADNSAIQTANANGDLELFLLLEQFGGHEKPGHPSEQSARSTDSASRSEGSEPATPLAALGLTELLPGKANLATSTPTHSKGRVSVIADDATVALADLLTVHLSAEPSLEIVERQELDRILSEQKLTRLFAADAANYGRVAGLLRADALLLINERKLAGRKLVESRLIRVNPGLVLDTVYAAAPIASAAEWAERMGTRVTGLASKVMRQDAIALSLLNIRASISSSSSRGLDRTLAVFLSDRLAHQPHFVILERSAMERLASENVGQFWTGSYLVDGALEPALDGSGSFALSVRFQPTGHGQALTFTTTGSRADPVAAVDDLLAKINAHLARSQPPARRDLADEAKWYLEEAKWALDAEQPALSQSAAEAAWALGLRSFDVARLRVLAAVRTVRDLYNRRLTDSRASAEWLDLAIHGATVWRDTLEGEVVRGHPENLRKWLELGLDATDGAILALLMVDTAQEQINQTGRLETLHELIWESLEETWKRSAELPTDSGIGNRASEKQAGAARLLFPRTSRFLPAVRTVLARHFRKEDSVTRARVRSNLLLNWSRASITVETSRTSGHSVSRCLSPGDEASHRLASELRNSQAPEDRYVSALLMIWTASLHKEATRADLDRLRASLFDMDKVLAEGGEVFGLYWERFKALDKLNGVPFFAINRTFSPNGDREWNRNTPEHAEFRRQLFLRICEVTKAPASDFKALVSLDQYTPDQAAPVAAAQARLGWNPPSPPPIAYGGFVPRSGSASVPEATGPQPPTTRVRPLKVRRLWNPFDLGLQIAPEFEADFGTMTWAEGRIWLHGCTLDQGGQPDKHYLFAIDPDSMRTETIPIPERSYKLNGRIIVTATHLLFVSQDLLAVRDRGTGSWETYKEIHAAEVTETSDLRPPALVGDSLYLIVADPPGNALIGFNFKQRTTEVLASTRRRPAASPFDDPGLHIKSVASNEAGEIVVVADSFAPNNPQIERVSHAWSPTQRLWREVHPRKLKSAVLRNAQPVRPQYSRVGTVGKVGGVVALHFFPKDASVNDIPLDFALPAGVRLPESRCGPQNIRPDYCNSFDGGVVLIPAFGSGFWVILQKELDDYRQQSIAAIKPAQSTSN